MAERKEVASNLKWKTSDMFADQAAWDALYEKVEKAIDFKKYEGKLGEKAEFKKCYDELYAVIGDLELLAVYASMRHDEDTRDSEFNALLSRVDALEVKFSSEIAFITPELTALDENILKGYIADPDLKDYDYELKDVLKSKKHVLGKEAEQVLAMGGQVYGAFSNIFGMINNADMPFPEITVDGKKVKLTHGTYSVLVQSPNREIRKKAFKALYKAYHGLLNTISATYIANVNKDVYLSKVRKYDSCLEKALDGEDVSPVVYQNLIKSVDKGLKTLHKYVATRKKILGVKQMHMYDIYTPLVENAELKLDYEDAFLKVKEGLKPLGEEYGKLLQRAHDEGWIDVCETEGKRSGAYSISVYKCPHPYVLLNYQQTTNDIFTIAHELGHAMHSYFSGKNQPQAKANYRIFVAEVASTVNEVLLLKYMLKTTTDKKLKKYLLNYYMDMIKSTLFRQTQFAEFEAVAHSAAENGVPLTKDFLNEEYLKLNKKYYGRSIVSDEEISYEWARIPHFYRAFYVYKYATGITSAISIAERIYNEGQPAVEDYFRFLSSGGSDSPVELLKLAGVDLTKKDAFNAAMVSFENALNEFIALG
ncbi:MAG: oligoendopeptidase F [Candidatus Borkfalkiaceae bacterium]|nr:oligoendopeptidase F [Christensenellaceae bacterium]